MTKETKQEKKITILLADDHAIVRDGLKVLLELEPDMQVIAEAETGTRAKELALELRPTITILDIAMPELNGLQVAREILEIAPDLKILLLSMHQNEEHIKHAIQLGISGYIVKESASKELITAIREIVRGKAYLSPIIVKKVLEYKPAGEEDRALSAREWEILEMIAQGKSNPEMSKVRNISTKTVEKHRQKLMHKLEIHNLAGLIKFAVEKGLVK